MKIPMKGTIFLWGTRERIKCKTETFIRNINDVGIGIFYFETKIKVIKKKNWEYQKIFKQAKVVFNSLNQNYLVIHYLLNSDVTDVRDFI